MKKENGQFVPEFDENQGYLYKTKRALRKGDLFEDHMDGETVVLEVDDMQVGPLGGIIFRMQKAVI